MWNYYLVESSNSKLVLNKSQAFFEQILITRAWNAEHGGVYVPITATTQPNQYLKDSLRDVVTTNGLELTKINPAFMTRQIAEMNGLKNDLQFHITSLKPIRPANKADSWEQKSLNMFENGVSENIELITDDSTTRYRYMAPLLTKNSCLKCHSEQGYKYGDIRGGISISFPDKGYTVSMNKQIYALAVIHLTVFILGIIGLWVYYRKANKYLLIIESKNNDLTQINATKDKFFSIIGHDLKSPFNSIIGFSDILIKKTNEKNYEDVDNYAKIIHDSSARAMNLLSNLLEWSRTQTGRLEVNPELFGFVNVINEVKEILNEAAHQKSIAIENEIQSNTLVFADREMISTVLRNLISNAIKFTQIGGKITISEKYNKNEFTVIITDTGVGISKERIPKLFIVGDSNSTLGTKNEKGTGLGLILCKEFIEMNNGEIWIESTVGIGSTFSFILPTKAEIF